MSKLKKVAVRNEELKSVVADVLQDLGYSKCAKQVSKRLSKKVDRMSDNLLVSAAKYILVAHDVELYDQFIIKYNLDENLCKFSLQEIETIAENVKTLRKLTTKRKAV